MTTGQAQAQEVLAEPARAAVFLVLTVRAGAEDDVRDVLTDVAGLTRAVGFRSPEGRLTCVASVGAGLWDRLYGQPRPAGLHPFRALAGGTHTAPATPGDLLFHLRARHLDLCFELARQLMTRLSGSADVVDEVHGFRYFDERDLMGFVDGTENPAGAAAVEAVTVGEEDADFAGGSYVIVQKYLHDLDAWNALTVEEQERVIGREKLSDIELADDVKPSNSHVALNTIEDEDGNELQVVRDNMAFGTVGSAEFGTYFIAYAKAPDVIEQMLQNMFIGKPAGNHDRILDFSTAVTGCLFYAPTADFLDDPPEPAPAGTQAAGTQAAATAPSIPAAASGEPDEQPAPADGSLGIGSLNRSASR